jgi:hypothetical protein
VTDTYWLVKDFHVLYQAAKAAVESAQRGVFITNELIALQVHLTRLSPAFDVCDHERQAPGLPPRLTPAERTALAALHRWLHSPWGDYELTEAAQDYHDQVEAESPSLCKQLDVEERDCPDVAPNLRADGAVALRDAFDAAVARDGIPPLRAGRRHTEPGPVGAIELGGPTAPRLPVAVLRAILADEHASNDAAGGAFVYHATSGAQMALHARHVHPGQVELVASLSAPLEEPHRSAWLTGYRIAAADGDESESPTLPDVGEPEAVSP